MPRNIYGVTKTAAEDLCELLARDQRLPCLVLRTSRFFPEPDDLDEARSAYDDLNLKVNELVTAASISRTSSPRTCSRSSAHSAIGFGRYVISATTPFTRERPASSCAATRAP